MQYPKVKIPLLKDGPLCKAEQIRKMTIKIVPDEQSLGSWKPYNLS